MSKSQRNRRRKNRFQRRTAPGAAPGVIEVDPQSPRPAIRAIAYGPDRFQEQTIDSPAKIGELLAHWPVTWVNVEGLGDAATIKELGALFNLHPLALEDVVNVHQRAKMEQYGDHLFIVARMARLADRLDTEQVSLFVGRNFVLTFLEDPGDSFDPVRLRLRGCIGRLRSAGTAFLTYSLLDAVVDAYFPVIELYGDRLDALEDVVVGRPEKNVISKIHDAKRDLRTLRRAIWPLREAINALGRDAVSLIDDETRIYLRDCYDHTVQIIDLVETYREVGSDLTDLYLSSLSNRMNEVMKVLTVISTIFMPLGFIAGVYGMNFDPDSSSWNMPELRSHWGYPFALGLMAAVAAAMLFFFYRQGWLVALALPPQPRDDADPVLPGNSRD